MSCSCGSRNPARIQDQDELRIGVTTGIASIVVGVAGILRNDNGEDSAFNMVIAATSDRVETVLSNNIGAGHILHCQASIISGANVDRGVYVNARIVRESGATDQPQFTLFSGYIDGGHQPSFPYGRNSAPLEGPGRLRSITGTNPAAGVEISETVPAGAKWKLRGIRAALVTDATVATRVARLLITDGANTTILIPPSATQTASLTREYNGLDAALYPTTSAAQLAWTLPSEVMLEAGSTITTSTTAIVAGDDWGAPQLLVEEWLVP